MRISVDVDEKLLKDVQQKLGQFHKKAPNAISSALNRATTTVNSTLKKEIRKDYHIKAGDVQSTLVVTRATLSNLGSEVRSKGNLIALDKFKVSPKTINPRRKSPVKVAVKKSGSKPLPGAFMAEINGPKLFKRTGKKRLPIQRLFGPSIPQMLGNEGIREEIESQGQQTFHIRLNHEINRMIDKGRS